MCVKWGGVGGGGSIFFVNELGKKVNHDDKGNGDIDKYISSLNDCLGQSPDVRTYRLPLRQ